MQRNIKIMQRNVTRTAQWIDVCPDCRSVLKLALIEAHPNHDKLGFTASDAKIAGSPHPRPSWAD
jgi:hypothetical protein